MSSRPAARTVYVSKAYAQRHPEAAREPRNSDAFLIAALTIFATLVAFYDLVLGLFYA